VGPTTVTHQWIACFQSASCLKIGLGLASLETRKVMMCGEGNTPAVVLGVRPGATFLVCFQRSNTKVSAGRGGATSDPGLD